MKLIVINGSRTNVFEKIVNSTTNSQTELTISEIFTPTDAGTYAIIVTATDLNGNINTTVPRTFLII